MTSYQKHWTEQLYHFAEHLYWVPQRINKITPNGEGSWDKFKQTQKKIRRQEVPLNILFNILIRLLPLRIKAQILNAFLPVDEVDFRQQIEYISIYERLDGMEYTQPDMILESVNANICIEIKVDALISLNQVYKYIFLLAHWQSELPTLRIPYLLFLTKKKLDAQWKTNERNLIFGQDDAFLGLNKYLRSNDLPDRLGGRSVINLKSEAKDIIDRVKFGWASWQRVGEILYKEKVGLSKSPESEGKEILNNLIGDFLDELARRKLWSI